MRKPRYVFWAVSIFCLCTSVWAGSSIHVSGEVWGTWPSGDSVIVEGPCVVPVDKELVIEAGVIIEIRGADPFVVEGRMRAHGSESQPILLVPFPGWEGFYFAPGGEVQELYFVLIPESAPNPARVIVGQDANIDVYRCQFHAAASCLAVTGGRLWCRSNILFTNTTYSKAVRIEYLLDDVVEGCQSPYGNRFYDNIVKVAVPRADRPLPPSEEFTGALYIRGSTNLCLSRNALSVIASGSTIGAYFGDVSPSGSQLWAMDSADVAVRSYDGVARGIFNALSGSLRVLHCNVDVAVLDPGAPFRSAGVLASQLADVVVNSSNVVLDQDTFFFVSISGGLLSVDFTNRWSAQSQAPNGRPVPGELGLSPQDVLDLSNPMTTVEYGAHCYFADPRFLREGEWGAWQSFADVAAYYEIDSLSPCIDAGDVQWGYDPDHTLPDIGRYFYERLQPDNVPPWNGGIASEVALAPAYPNPFNAVTTFPLALARAGNVRLIAFDVLGRRVAAVDAGLMSAGDHEVQLDASEFATGLYLVQLEVQGEMVARQKIILLK